MTDISTDYELFKPQNIILGFKLINPRKKHLLSVDLTVVIRCLSHQYIKLTSEYFSLESEVKDRTIRQKT